LVKNIYIIISIPIENNLPHFDYVAVSFREKASFGDELKKEKSY
jgi:hypothetical protein